jgi:hypothetical protein
MINYVSKMFYNKGRTPIDLEFTYDKHFALITFAERLLNDNTTKEYVYGVSGLLEKQASNNEIESFTKCFYGYCQSKLRGDVNV